MHSNASVGFEQLGTIQRLNAVGRDLRGVELPASFERFPIHALGQHRQLSRKLAEFRAQLRLLAR